MESNSMNHGDMLSQIRNLTTGNSQRIPNMRRIIELANQVIDTTPADPLADQRKRQAEADERVRIARGGKPKPKAERKEKKGSDRMDRSGQDRSE
jgi:hypothetical protein